MVKRSISAGVGGKGRGIGGGFAVAVPGITRPRLLDRPDGEGGADPGAGGATATAGGEGEGDDPPASGQTQTQGAGATEDFTALLNAVTQRTQQAVEPINRQVQELAARINQAATQPGSQAAPNRVFGGGRAPGVASGPTWGKLESQGYRFSRAFARVQGSQYLSADQTKLEHDIHQKLYKFYVEQGGLSLGGVHSILTPYGTAEICDIEPGFGAELRQMVSAGVTGADPGQIRQMATQHMIQSGMGMGDVNQALSMFDDTALGVFTTAGMGEMIELVRAREVFSRLGASQITLPPNGYLPMPRQTGASDAYWVGENAPITESRPSTGTIEMRARKLAALVTFPNELVRFATASVEAFLRMDIARSMALKADRAFMEGTGTTTQPRGLLTYSGIIAYPAGTVGANGDTFEPEDPSNMMALIEEANFDLDVDGFSWVMRPTMFSKIRNRRASVYDGTDLVEKGAWLFDTNRGDHTLGTRRVLESKPVVTTSQVSNTRSKGSNDALTYVLGGIFSNWVIGNHGVMEFATATEGDTIFANDQRRVRAIRHVDAIPRHEECFVLCDTLDPALPS